MYVSWFILQSGVRDNATIMYNTSLGVIFGVKKYAERLLEVVKKKDIQLNYKHKLIEVNVPSKEAVFEVLEEDRTVTFKVSQIIPLALLHRGPRWPLTIIIYVLIHLTSTFRGLLTCVLAINTLESPSLLDSNLVCKITSP